MGFWRQIGADRRYYRTVHDPKALHNALLERGFWITATYRLGAWACRQRTPLWGRIVRLIYWAVNLLVSTLTGADIRSGAILGQRFTVHTSRGLLITNGVRVGDDCIVNAGVCMVHRADGQGRGVPTIGDQVRIGLGAKILGPVVVGDRAVIGANAVVLRDVPTDHLAVGVPAVNKPLVRDPAAASPPQPAVPAEDPSRPHSH